jgi:hypothetical protein
MNPYHIAFWEDRNLLWNWCPWFIVEMKLRKIEIDSHIAFKFI